MKLNTRHFGEIDISESKIIVFEEGLPGFEDLTRFVLFHNEAEAAEEDNDGVFLWLQSLDDGEVAFVLLNTFMFMPDYDPKIEDSALESLGGCSPEDLIIRNIATITDKLENMTVNLCAPVVINSSTQKGKQVLSSNKDYHVRHRILQESKEAI